MPASYRVVIEFLDDRPDLPLTLSMADRIAAKRKTGGNFTDPEFDAYATWLAAKRDGYESTFEKFCDEVTFIKYEDAPGKD